MKNSLMLALLLSSYPLSGCVESTLVVGKTGPGINSAEVIVYFIDRPACNFETVAHISINGATIPSSQW